MFNVKRINQLEKILLESNLIKTNQQFVAINQDYQKANNDNDKSNIYQRLDYLIDMMIDQQIINFEKDLEQPIGEREFGSDYGTKLIIEYLKYCKTRLIKLSELINVELKKSSINTEKLKSLSIDRIKIAARIEALDQIYTAFKKINDQDLHERAESVLSEIIRIKSEMTNAYAKSIEEIGLAIKEPLILIKKQDKQKEQKKEYAGSILTKLNGLDTIIQFYPADDKKQAEQAENTIEGTIINEIGNEDFEKIKKEILNSEEELVILRRILRLKYMHFGSEEDLFKEVDQIKVSINGLEGTRNRMPISKPAAITYLRKVLQDEVSKILANMRAKNITTKETKGIHYDFNIKLPLYTKVALSVNGKQIADNSKIMKFRKRFQSIMDLIPAGSIETTPAGEAWANFGQQTHLAYAKVLNKAGRVIGKMVGGREGEMKGDAITRLLIPSTDVLNNDKLRSNETINEEGSPVAGGSTPGTAYQVPSSIGSQGAIQPPTENTIGSGDKFQPGIPKKKTKKKKKKKKTVYEKRLTVMNFSTFSK